MYKYMCHIKPYTFNVWCKIRNILQCFTTRGILEGKESFWMYINCVNLKKMLRLLDQDHCIVPSGHINQMYM